MVKKNIRRDCTNIGTDVKKSTALWKETWLGGEAVFSALDGYRPDYNQLYV